LVLVSLSVLPDLVPATPATYCNAALQFVKDNGVLTLMTQGDNYRLEFGKAAQPDADRPEQGIEERKNSR
jgi:hypothetical protein